MGEERGGVLPNLWREEVNGGSKIGVWIGEVLFEKLGKSPEGVRVLMMVRRWAVKWDIGRTSSFLTKSIGRMVPSKCQITTSQPPSLRASGTSGEPLFLQGDRWSSIDFGDPTKYFKNPSS